MKGLMEYGSLMVYVDDIDSANARIELACGIADLFDAGLIGISGGIPDMPTIDPYTGGAMLGEVWTQRRIWSLWVETRFAPRHATRLTQATS
jgi:hypothetical protein